MGVPTVSRVGFPGGGKFDKKRSDGYKKQVSGAKIPGQEHKCPYCVFLSGALKAKLHTNHNPDCYMKE